MLKVLVAGDSNTNRFYTGLGVKEIRERRKLDGRVEYEKLLNKPRTCQGFRQKPASESIIQARKALSEINIKEFDLFTTLLGSLDCDTTIWHRIKKYKTTVDEEITFAVSRLEEFLKNDVEKYFSPEKIVVGPVLSQYIEEYTKESKGRRAENNSPLKARVICTRKFNRALREMAKKNGYHFFNTATVTANKDGTLKEKFRPKDNNVHGHPKLGIIYENRLLAINKKNSK